MNRLWAYVKQVERRLPRSQRIETVGGLYATLKARLAAVEKDAGRKATPEEIDALLKAEGDPVDVAARLTRSGGQGLVERYLAAVARRLPPEGAHDLIAELREAIGARLEAREAETGRPAGADDEAAVLRDFGHPYRAAARYAGRDHLVGPQLYPWFWPAQHTAVGAVVAINMVIALFRAVQSDRPVQAVLQGMSAAFTGGLIMFAVVVAVFVMLDRAGAGAQYESRWDPRRLPRDEVRKPKSLFDSIVALAADAIFIGVWLGLIQIANHWPDRDPSAELAFGDVWGAVHTPILVLAFVSAAVHVADIFHPAWSRLRAVVSLAAYAAGLAVMWMLLRADTLVELVPIAGADSAPAADWIGLSLRLTLAAIALAWAVAAMVEAIRLARSLRRAGPALHA